MPEQLQTSGEASRREPFTEALGSGIRSVLMLPPNLEIDLLRAFVAVAETGSFTAAGFQVGRSQSAVSQKVLRLEKTLECRVFDRTSRAFALTQHGERLLTVARQILSINDAAMRELRGGPPARRLTLGVAEDFVHNRLPKLLAQFGRLNPDVQLHIATGLSCDLLTAYDERRIDAVIARKDGVAQRGRVIWREPLVWLASTDYEIEAKNPVELVTLRPPCIYRQLMIASMDLIRRDWRMTCTAGSLTALQAAVAGGLGITILGQSFVQSTMRILRTPAHWPPLPMTEIIFLGEKSPAVDLLEPLLISLQDFTPPIA